MSRTALVAAAVALPPMLALMSILSFAVGESHGATVLSYGLPVNLAEAAGMSNAAEVLRRLDGGEDPMRVQQIRPEILSAASIRLTAL